MEARAARWKTVRGRCTATAAHGVRVEQVEVVAVGRDHRLPARAYGASVATCEAGAAVTAPRRSPARLAAAARRDARSPAHAGARSRSHSTVSAIPSSSPRRASQPSCRRAFSTDGQRRCTSTSKLGRCSSSNVRRVLAAGRPDHARDLGYRQLLGGGDVEVLVLGRRGGHRGHDAVGDVVDVRERARLLAGAEDLQWPLPGAAPLRSGPARRGRCPARRVGQLAGTVGVEGAADRVAAARARRVAARL